MAEKKKLYLVYHQNKILDITEDHVRAQEKASTFVFENDPLKCDIAELAVVNIEKYPYYEEKKND